jgi:oligoendopeptidase F
MKFRAKTAEDERRTREYFTTYQNAIAIAQGTAEREDRAKFVNRARKALTQIERHVHEERRTGELTSDRLGEIWMKVQGESLGPAINLSEGYETFWCYVPHFIHSPFYVYAYAFGDCLVNSLFGLYQEAHPGFVAKYFAMLEAGGSKHHSELLAPFGLDATQRAFWQKGLSVISGMIDELERM